MSKKVDKTYAAGFTGKARFALHTASRSLAAKRNGVVSFFAFVATASGALQVSALNTRPDKVSVSRKFQVGRRGGLYMERPGYRRYFKAVQLGKGSL